MASSIDFTIALIDKITAPAKAMVAQLKVLEAALGRVAKDTSVGGKSAAKIAPPVPPAALAPLKLLGGQLDLLKQSLRDDKLAVTNLSASMRQLKQATMPNIAAIRAVDEQLKAAKNRLAETQVKLVRSGNAARFGSEGTNRLTTTLRELAEKAGVMPGRLGAFSQKLAMAGTNAGELVSTLGPAGAAVAGLGAAALATTAAVGLLAMGIGALIFKGASLAIAAAEAKGDTLDMLEAMLGTEKAAKATYDQLIGITRVSAASKELVTSAAQELAAAGIDNQQRLVSAVQSIAQVESVLKGGGAKVQAMLEKAAQTGKFELSAKQLRGTGVQVAVLYEELAKRTGLGVKQIEAQLKAGKITASQGIDALTSVIDKKFGALSKKQALDLPAQLQRFKDNVGRLFDGVNTQGFLVALSKIVDLFDTSTIAGAAMKDMVTGAFDKFFKVVEAGAPYVTTFLKGLIIIALQVAIAFKPLIAKLRESFGGEANKGPLTLAKTMSLIGQTARAIIEPLVKIATNQTMWKVLGFLVDVTAIAFSSMFMAITGVWNATVGLITVGARLLSWLTEIGPRALEAGVSIVSGLVEGIRSAAGSLYAVVTDMASTAFAKFTSFFDMRSPSRKMMKAGIQLDTGLAMGIRAGAPAVNDNMRRVVEPPRASQVIGRSAGSRSLSIQEGAVQMQIVVQDGRELEERMPNIMANIFEQLALTEGRFAATGI